MTVEEMNKLERLAKVCLEQSLFHTGEWPVQIHTDNILSLLWLNNSLVDELVIANEKIDRLEAEATDETE